MYSLILDSSTQILYISLVKDNEVLFEKYMPGNKDHAKNIVYLVNQALENNHIESKDLDEIIVGYGPGSYLAPRDAPRPRSFRREPRGIQRDHKRDRPGRA